MAENLERKTEWGSVLITKNAMGSILDEAMAPWEDRVWIADRRRMLGGLANAVGRRDEYSELKVEFDEEDRISLSLDIVVRFGTSIKAVTDGMIATLVRGFERLTGKPPKQVCIHVVGTMSRQMIPRDIEVLWNDESR